MSCSSKNSDMHAVTGYDWWRERWLLFISMPYTQKKLWLFISTSNQNISAKYKNNPAKLFSHQILILYLINKTESPANSRFVLTKTLQPVVSRCLFGWPVTWNPQFNMLFCFPHRFKIITRKTKSPDFMLVKANVYQHNKTKHNEIFHILKNCPKKSKY